MNKIPDYCLGCKLWLKNEEERKMKEVKVEIMFNSTIIAILNDATTILKHAFENICSHEDGKGFKFGGKIFISKIKEEGGKDD